MIFKKKYDDPKKAEAIKKLINYSLTEGQKISRENGLHSAAGKCHPEVKKAAENIK